MSCWRLILPPSMPVNPELAALGQGGTRLIQRPNDKPTPTQWRETDARTALARGLGEYLRQLSFEDHTSRLHRFERVSYDWEVAGVDSVYPAAGVTPAGDSKYDAQGLGGSSPFKVAEGLYLKSWAELTTTLMVEVFGTDQVERQQLVAMLEDALNPVDWMVGCRLELPHYFNERATYGVLSCRYVDGDAEVSQESWKAVMMVEGRVLATRLVTHPSAQIRAHADVTV